jgi:hypothetical protein
MPRLEVELTSARPDGIWTWRKAGARQPKGELDGSLLPPGTSVGDVVRVEAEALLDGLEITAVLPPKEAKAERFERIEITGTRRDDTPVTTTPAPRARRERTSSRPGRSEADRTRRPPRGERPARRPAPERPRPKRLRPLRRHRDAVLEALPTEHRVIAEQVLRGGVAAVRAEVERVNAARRTAGQELLGDQLVVTAEELYPRLRAAEWMDRAEAARAIVEEVDLRDLRSVVVAADGVRDEAARELAAELRAALERRVEEEHRAWLEEMSSLLDDGRVVRALRLSSRPPKAGVPLPQELANRLIGAAQEALSSDAGPDRWAAVIEVLAYSPVRTAVRPAEGPASRTDALEAAVRAAADRLPQIAQLFGLEPVTSSAPGQPRRRPRRSADQPQQVERVVEDHTGTDAAREGSPGAGVPASPGEPATDLTGAAEVVERVADEPEPADPGGVEPEFLDQRSE